MIHENQKNKSNAENSNIWGNRSEHLFRQAIVTVILPISINQPALHPGIQVFHFNLLF